MSSAGLPASPTPAKWRIVGKRIKPDGDVSSFFRYDTQSPMKSAERFVLGEWRTVAIAGANLASDVQRGVYVELPSDYEGLVNSTMAMAERVQVTYDRVMANAIAGLDRTKADSWLGVLLTHSCHVVASSRITLGNHDYWLVEVARFTPLPPSPVIGADRQRKLAGSRLESVIETSVYSMEPAAAKAFNAKAQEHLQAGRLEAFRNKGARSSVPFTAAPDYDRLACNLADVWARDHAEEERKKNEARKRAEEAERAAEAQREQDRLDEIERQRRIASGDATVLNDQDLASRLRARRAKEQTS